MRTCEREQTNRLIKALEKISVEMKGIWKCLEIIADGDAGKGVPTDNGGIRKNDHRED